MTSNYEKEAEKRMKKCIESLHQELTKLRTGRANPSLIEHIKVSYYGNETPLSQVATITVSDARTITVKPWEKKMIPDIEKAIMTSDLGLNPVSSGSELRVPIPAMTEERRKELVKLVKQEAENARVAIRNIRRDANQEITQLVKDKTFGEDEERRAQDKIQKMTDQFIAEVDKVLSEKEKDVMAV